MDPQQFQQFMNGFASLLKRQQDLTDAIQSHQNQLEIQNQQLQQLQQQQPDGNATGSGSGQAPIINNNGNNNPKIPVKIPIYKGEPNENVLVWLLRIESIFAAQNVTNNEAKINYASTGLEDAAFHWYLNKLKANVNNINPTFANFDTFAQELRNAFQPPNYQQHLRR